MGIGDWTGEKQSVFLNEKVGWFCYLRSAEEVGG